MKTRLACFILAVITVLTAYEHEAYGQMNRRSIKKNNKRISSYRGRKFHFGKEKIYNSVGFSLNAMNYYGDLSPTPKRISTDIGFTRPGFGISFTHRFGPRYQVTANFIYGTLRGGDAESADPNDDESGKFRYWRNLSFRNRVKELSVVAQLDLFENQATYISRVSWTPFIFLGIAVFHHNPQAQVPATDLNGVPFKNAGEWVDLQPLGTEGQHAKLDPNDVNHGVKPYKRIQPAIPMGLGVRFRINEVMDFSAELGFRYIFTDYLDDVSGNYVDLGVFANNEEGRLARALSYRSGEVRPDLETYTYTGRDGNSDTVIPGYGYERDASGPGDIGNLRGNKDDRDIYMVTTFRLTYILGKTFHRAKFR